MTNQKAFINISGAMDFIKKSQNPLAPIFEALTNSLESLAQKKQKDDAINEIRLDFYFNGTSDEVKRIDSIEITDNGVGFNDKNYARFIDFFNKTKGYNNRGTGRLQFFHRFNNIVIDSVFERNNKLEQRSFKCTKEKFIDHEDVISVRLDERNFETKITLFNNISTNSDVLFFDNLTIENIKKLIKNHFLLRFYLDDKKRTFKVPNITITFYKNSVKDESEIIDSNNIVVPDEEGEIKVPYMKIKDTSDNEIEWIEVKGNFETIKWAHFVIAESELDKNSIFLCSKDVPVESVKFNQLNMKEVIKGKRFLTAFYGEVLDIPTNVSHSVDRFEFPSKKSIENGLGYLLVSSEKKYMLMESIEEGISKVIPHIYRNVLNVKEEQIKNIEEIARAHGISMVIAKKVKINLSDSEKIITKKLYVEQSKDLADKSYKAKKIFEDLKSIDPTSDNYQDEIQKKTEKLSNLVEEQNKEELSRYIIRREMISEILMKMVDEELDYQNTDRPKGKNKDKEGLIHDLIFKRKSSSTSTLNDLWILNEDFLHFEGCSDLPLNQIETHDGEKLLQNIPKNLIEELGLKPTRRPDIFLFGDEEKCLIIELKEPDTDLSDYLNQMPKYCTIIANYSSKKISRFYCYLIGEKINPVTDLTGEYNETVNGDWLRENIKIVSYDANRNQIANAQLEVIKLSSIYKRAHRRNQSFADKLGLHDLLKKKNTL